MRGRPLTTVTFYRRSNRIVDASEVVLPKVSLWGTVGSSRILLLSSFHGRQEVDLCNVSTSPPFTLHLPFARPPTANVTYVAHGPPVHPDQIPVSNRLSLPKPSIPIASTRYDSSRYVMWIYASKDASSGPSLGPLAHLGGLKSSSYHPVNPSQHRLFRP